MITEREFKKLRNEIVKSITYLRDNRDCKKARGYEGVEDAFNYTKALVKRCKDMKALCRLIVRRSAFFQYYKILNGIALRFEKHFEEFGIFCKRRGTKGLELWELK